MAAFVPLAISVTKLISAELAQHTLRLRDAANENAALDALIPAFDADLQQIAQAYNSGTDPQTCIAALLAVDTNAYNYLQAQVGKSGTAWGGPSSAQIGSGVNPSYSAACGKTCTAGCCVYLNDLRPAIFGRSGVGSSYLQYQSVPGIVGGMIEAIQKGGGTVKIIPIAAPPNTAYGNYARASYVIQLVQPPSGSGLGAAVLQTSGSGAGLQVVAEPAPSAPTALLGSLTGNNSVAILTVVTAFILIITALFGQKALQVTK